MAGPGHQRRFNDIRPDEARALCREIVEARGEDWLTPEEFQSVANAFGLPLVPGVLARTPEDATAVASAFRDRRVRWVRA
jgi:hypothetical protein